MALKNLRQRIVAFTAGVLLGPAVVWAGLETGVYISDLVATNPLSSDLASTADDHLRLIKTTVKNSFPNVDGAVSSSDEELSLVDGLSGTIWTSANDGAASTLDADTLDTISSAGFLQTSTYQALAPTWTGKHIFSFSGGGSGAAINISAAAATWSLNETDASTDNKLWDLTTSSEQLLLRTVNDASAVVATIMAVDRTGTVVDRVTFPTTAGATSPFYVGQTAVGTLGSTVAAIHTDSASNRALSLASPTAATHTLVISNEATAGDNAFIGFYTENLLDTLRGSVTYNRGAGLVAFNTSSADNLKSNVRPAKSARGIINCIPVVSHDWKQGPGHMDHWVTAGKLNRCAPFAVSYGKAPEIDGSVDVSKLVPALIKYVQEQDARIAALERRLN